MGEEEERRPSGKQASGLLEGGERATRGRAEQGGGKVGAAWAGRAGKGRFYASVKSGRLAWILCRTPLRGYEGKEFCLLPQCPSLGDRARCVARAGCVTGSGKRAAVEERYITSGGWQIKACVWEGFLP